MVYFGPVELINQYNYNHTYKKLRHIWPVCNAGILNTNFISMNKYCYYSPVIETVFVHMHSETLGTELRGDRVMLILTAYFLQRICKQWLEER